MDDRDAGPESDGDTLPSGPRVAAAAAKVLEDHWRGRFCVPSPRSYPWQWLWDSCFHAVAWAHLGDERAVVELGSVFDAQDPSGFVPHVNYRDDHVHASFWGRPTTSCITQPPLYGHAVAELDRLGFSIPDRVVEQARLGLRYLLDDRPRHRSGLVAIVHPWESGADDSPRWDHWLPVPESGRTWYDVKGELVGTIERDDRGLPRRNEDFDVASVGFNALVAFDARELGDVLGDRPLLDAADELAELVDRRWVPELETWVDAGAHEPGSGRVGTLDALLPALVVGADRSRRALLVALDPDRFGGACGPAGVDRREPVFDPTRYWRGAAWPQLTYLLTVAARRQGRTQDAERLATRMVRGATRSGFAEYWHPDTGAPLGARPQSWAALAAAVGFN